MAKNILKDFIAILKTNGVAKVNRFSVELTPVGKPIQSNFRVESLLLYCSQANIPGTNISTNPAKIFSETFEFAYEKLYGPLSLSFYVDANMEVKKIFDAWTEKIQDPKTKRFGYYSDYTTDITLNVFDNKNRNIYSIVFYEAFPKTVNDIQLDYSGTGIMSLPVTFSYRYFKTFSVIGVGESTARVTKITPELSNLLSGDQHILKDYISDFSTFQESAFNEISNIKTKISSTAKDALNSILKK